MIGALQGFRGLARWGLLLCLGSGVLARSHAYGLPSVPRVPRMGGLGDLTDLHLPEGREPSWFPGEVLWQTRGFGAAPDLASPRTCPCLHPHVPVLPPGDAYLPNVMHPPPPSARHPPLSRPRSAIRSRPRPPTTPSPPSDLREHLSIPHYSLVLRGLSLLFHLPSHPPTPPARLLISALCAGSWAGSWPQELVCLAHRERAG